MDKRVALMSCKTYERDAVDTAISKILASFGGARALAGGKRVLIKPNLLMARSPDEATTTHPAVVAALTREFIAADCQVTIADSCGGTYSPAVLKKLYHACGMEAVAEETGAQLNFDVSSANMEYHGGKRIGRIPVIKPVHDAEFVVTVGKMKTHGLTYYTGAVKNLFGVVPGLTKPMFHSRFPEKIKFCEMIVDLCELVSPGFAVLDGIVGMEGKGPSGGIPKSAGVLLGGVNPHAVDLAAIRVMGFEPESVPTLKDAISRGLIPASAKELDYFGEDAEKFELKFNPPPGKAPGSFVHWLPKFMQKPLEHFFVPYPYINIGKCVGCGDCAQTCPMHTIEILDKKAQIHYDKCVKCYCCHELCPIRAIEFKRNVKK